LEERARELVKTRIVDPILSGIPQIDKELKIYPGTTLIYSHPDGGRTSVAKRIAISARRQGLNVMYYDTENKLMHHDPSLMNGIGLATAYRDSGLKELVANGLIDMMVVDTITGIHKSSQEAFMIGLRKQVPYIVILTQMRDIPNDKSSSPATKGHVLSAAHTWVYLTSREKVIIEGKSVARVQYQYTKCERERGLTGNRGSFIIRNNIVDPIYSAYDFLRSSGYIRSVGRCKLYTPESGPEVQIGTVKEVCEDKALSESMMHIWMKENSVLFPVEVYVDQHM